MSIRFTKALRWEICALIVVYFLACLFIIVFSPTVLLYVGHDISPVLDGTWRIENNQIPHKDFSSILGYGYLLQQYFFLKTFHYDFIAFAYSSLTITTIIFLLFLSFYRSQKFLEESTLGLRIYFFLLLVSLGLGQYHFGEKHTLLTYANLYNRYSFLCLFAVCLQGALLKDVKKITVGVVMRLVVIAFLLTYLFFVKLTYFAVALGLVSLYGFTSVISVSIYLRLLVISLFVLLGFTWAMKADLPAMFQDYKTISLARGKVFTDPAFIRSKLLQYYNILFLASLFFFLIEMRIRRLPVRFFLITAFIGVCAIFLQFTNWGTTDIVMLTFVPVVAVLAPSAKRFISFKIFLAVGCFFIFKNFRSIYYLSKVNTSDYTELKSPYLSRFYTDFTEVKCGRNYAPWVMSGASLVDKNKKPGDKVFSFSFDNPFPFITHTVPPKYVSIVWQYQTTYSYSVYIPTAKLFSDVDLLLIPVCSGAESASEMMRIYGDVIRNEYGIIDRNEEWVLYRKVKLL